MAYGFDSNLIGNSLDSMIQVNDEEGTIFEAKWTGPEIVANQRSDGAGVEFASTTLFMTDVLFLGIYALGFGLGGALIYRLLK